MPAVSTSHDVPQPGDVLGGKYRVESLIGIGGMGAVVAARHATLGHRVAVKVLLSSAAKIDDAVARFLREGRAAASLASEHVCKVLDVGETSDGRPFIVIELLFGTDLGTVIENEPPLPIATAVDYLLQASEAIAEAHSLGIIHRDLKPSNLFLTTRADGTPLVKVLDFGISKMTREVDVAITTTEMALGTPLYMSPEQIRSLKTVDARTDIWSLGIILHQLLTRRAPFEGSTLTALSAAIASDTPTPLRRDRPDAPAGLEAVIARCLEKSAAHRYPTVAALAADLAPFASAGSVWLVERIAAIDAGTVPAQIPNAVPSGPVGDGRADTRSAWGQTRRQSKQSTQLLLGIVTATMLASVVGIGFLAWPRARTEAPAPAASGPPPAMSAAPTVAAEAPAPPPAASEGTVVAAPDASVAPKKRRAPSPNQRHVDPLQDRR